MNAHALLTSQGWRGTGHSLHPTNDTTGLKRPLLVSRKDNVLGIGKKQHRTSDMWWMNAFDSSLKGLDTSKTGTVVQTVTSGGLDMVKMGGGKYVGKTGLYSSFVKGEGLGGTITPEERASSLESTSSTGSEVDAKKRRKSERGAKETKEERRARKAAKRASRAKDAQEEEESGKLETKGERKEGRRLRKLAKAAEKNYLELASEKAKKKKKKDKKDKKEKSKK